MNFEQILIRIGVDATAVKSGLGRVGASVKGWGVSLVEDLKGTFGRLFAAGAAIEGLNRIREKILEISRVSRETGANTNFVQGLMQEAEKSGLDFNEMAGGIAQFNKLLGAAKMGSLSAVIQLKDMHVVTDKNSVSTLNFTSAMHNLSIRFSELNDKQKQAYLLSQAFGKSYAALTPIFDRGTAGVDSLSSGNPFTKISKGAIQDYSDLWRGIKTTSTVVAATVVNVLDLPFRAVAKVSYGLGLWSRGIKSGSKEYTAAMKEMNDADEKITAEKEVQAEADKEGITVAELKTKILNEQAELLEKQAELSSDIADRDKESVSEMASQARKVLGIKSPLENFHTVTPRMRTALRISELEDKATIATLRGNDSLSGKLQSEADQIRASSPWLKRQDRNPMAKTESELSRVNQQLAPVAEMAKLVTATK